MTKELRTIIFGLNDYAELAHWYLTNDSQYQPMAFCVESKYKDRETFNGLPVFEWETLDHDGANIFAPMSPIGMNSIRQRIYEEGKKRGYNFINYISSKATILSPIEGDNNFILENNVIQPFVKIGSNNVFWSGNHIGHHSVIGNHNTFTSHVVLSGHCTVGDNCFFGVNSTVRDGRDIRHAALIGQGANLLTDAAAYGVYGGNPAKLISDKLSTSVL